MIEVKKQRQRQKLLILLFKNVLKISNFEKSTKKQKNLKNNEKKTFFLFGRFYTGRKNFINEKGLFYAKFFEFEEFSIVPFFCSSIQPQHTVIQDENF